MKIEIKVFPGSNREGIFEKDGKVKVYVHASADKGKANMKVIELFAKRYGVRKKDVNILRGAVSRNKILEVDIGG